MDNENSRLEIENKSNISVLQSEVVYAHTISCTAAGFVASRAMRMTCLSM
jgi:hypothetical protein